MAPRNPPAMGVPPWKPPYGQSGMTRTDHCLHLGELGALAVALQVFLPAIAGAGEDKEKSTMNGNPQKDRKFKTY